MKMRNMIVMAVASLSMATGAAEAANMWAGGGASSAWNTSNVIWSDDGAGGPFDLAWDNTANANDIAIFDGATGLTGNGKFDIKSDIVVGGIKILNNSDVYGFTGDKQVSLGAGGLDFDLAKTSHNNQKFQKPDFVLTADQTWKIRQNFKIQTSATLDVNGQILQIDMTDDDATARTLGGTNSVFPVFDNSATPGVFRIIGGNVARVDFSGFAGDVRIDDGAALLMDYSDAAMSAEIDLLINGTGTFDAGSGNTYTVNTLTLNDQGLAPDTYNAVDHDWLTSGTVIVNVPEPASLALVGIGGLTLMTRRRRSAPLQRGI